MAKKTSTTKSTNKTTSTKKATTKKANPKTSESTLVVNLAFPTTITGEVVDVTDEFITVKAKRPRSKKYEFKYIPIVNCVSIHSEGKVSSLSATKGNVVTVTVKPQVQEYDSLYGKIFNADGCVVSQGESGTMFVQPEFALATAEVNED